MRRTAIPIVLLALLAGTPRAGIVAPSAFPIRSGVAEAASDTAATGPCEAEQALSEMDTRTPVPLLPMMADHQKQNMRDHLTAVQEIVAALASEDFEAVERAAARMGFTEEMGKMCTHMGAGAPGFTEQALHFHHTADTIVETARRHDRSAVTSALAVTLATCTACHAKFRQRVVDQSTWSQLTSSPAPHGDQQHP